MKLKKLETSPIAAPEGAGMDDVALAPVAAAPVSTAGRVATLAAFFAAIAAAVLVGAAAAMMYINWGLIANA